ncbi:hypothetical protein FIBSPDRAFT_964174 [Athelia psychrophila]|uniref:Uncharacterized protein n=1 Tax=Athelia psychrophila TaxID=1759441 RepID=A0A165Y393_9AGAM|nr:hypothetical protein FIBSPDRAFT_964174 [Fibularhizoctonia sp. CBS 109695]
MERAQRAVRQGLGRRAPTGASPSPGAAVVFVFRCGSRLETGDWKLETNILNPAMALATSTPFKIMKGGGTFKEEMVLNSPAQAVSIGNTATWPRWSFRWSLLIENVSGTSLGHNADAKNTLRNLDFTDTFKLLRWYISSAPTIGNTSPCNVVNSTVTVAWLFVFQQPLPPDATSISPSSSGD